MAEATAGLLEKKEESESRRHFCLCAITDQSAGVCLKNLQNAASKWTAKFEPLQPVKPPFQISGKKK